MKLCAISLIFTEPTTIVDTEFKTVFPLMLLHLTKIKVSHKNYNWYPALKLVENISSMQQIHLYSPQGTLFFIYCFVFIIKAVILRRLLVAVVSNRVG